MTKDYNGRDFESVLNNRIKRLKASKTITEANKRAILKFHHDCFSNGLSVRRVMKYLLYLPKLADMLGEDFRKADKEDIKKVIASIERGHYAEWTKCDLRVMLKRFYKWFEGEDEFYPKKVRWIKTTFDKVKKTLPEDILIQSEIKKMIEAASHIRDKAMIFTLYESGCRIGELLTMRIKNVEFDNFGTIIRVHGKTGSRRIRLVDSSPYLSNWMAHHPHKKDKESALWVSIGTMNHSKLICYNTARKILMDTAKKAGVDKKVNPHNFRHSRATHLANILKESQMSEYFGWVQGTKQTKTYVHLSGRDLDKAILEMHGLRKPEDSRKEKILEPKKCPRCERLNECEANICCKCGLPLDVKTALEQEKRGKEMAKLLKSEDMIEKLIKKKIEQILTERMKKDNRMLSIAQSASNR